MAFTFITEIFTEIDSVLLVTLGSKTASIINIISPVMMSAFIFYVLLVTMSYMINGTDLTEVGGDLIKRFLAWAVIIGLSMNIGNFTSIIVPIANNVPQEIMQAISGGSNATITSSLDNLISMYLDVIATMFSNIEFMDIGGYLGGIFIGGIMVIGGFIFVIIASGYILLAKVTTAILLVIAPIFIGLALFPATRQYASLWVGQLVNAGLIMIIISVICAVEIGILERAVSGVTDLDITTASKVAIASGIFTVLLNRVPDLASALAGGMSLNGFGQTGRSVSNSAKAGMSAGRSVAGAGASAGRAGADTFNAIKNRFGGNAIKPEGAGK